VESSRSAFSEEAGYGEGYVAVDFMDGDFALLVDEEMDVDFETELGGDVCERHFLFCAMCENECWNADASSDVGGLASGE
jgi:hypothetical protein